MSDDNLAREQKEETVRRVLILTGGGDAPGLNAVLRAFVKTATGLGLQVYGSEDGFAGLIEEPNRVVRLMRSDVRGILPKGGSILGCSDKANPFAYGAAGSDGGPKTIDVSDRVLAKLDELEIDTLVLVGGGGTMKIGMRFAQLGVQVVGIPKAIGNDLAATDLTFGLDSAVSAATTAIDTLHSTGEAHDRVMVLEVMGHDAGWIALMSGIAGGADVILIPEIYYDVDRVIEKIAERSSPSGNFSIVVVGEGSKPVGGTVSSITEKHHHLPQRPDGSGFQLARLLEGRIDHEIRVTVLGDLQRGGSPSPFDRILGTRFGVRAAELCYHDNTGQVVALRGQDIVSVPLEAAVANLKRVPPDGELVAVARALGIELGQE
ncbi:MAG: ATP-dependent 6-phosphofructokinase [Deltaproteobacteria bacterium]|nr:ATP-dependent 6-phosphofructokinase [Deltaproteobacteria bacterium]NND28079.1 ATP-dependent 6-phosphofructokinase [Myxococcales bacterium]MBT8465838.1 ATP-dependent 6-phosphofructokinase [Deltaproteobacteria bacterium]MBT8483569.1 ATP-dependent 6-phosphofructokinase [Deltaproteobacteria bacterium]NNK08633.1 ATP-dependent 6-phosphofructokinase [Myxococcales bacterium]